MNPSVYMIMSMARSQALAANIEPPHVWYCTHLLGNRMCVVANRTAMEESATWPGDFITDDATQAEEWLAAPPEQDRLGIAPAKSATPTAPVPAPAPAVRVTHACVSIRWWVDMCRQPPDVHVHYHEIKRTQYHQFVEVQCTKTGRFDVSIMCDCGRALIGVDDIECPEGIGCTVEVEDGENY